jgi:trehalose 6-phosphate synthase
MAVAHNLREMKFSGKIGFFLHTPFPPLDLFLKLPWRDTLLRDLLAYDLVGFQTLRDRRNFVQCVRSLLHDVSIGGKGQVLEARIENREIRIGTFPISIDYNEFAEHAASPEVAERAWYLHEDFPERQLILGVDRLDYTKGVPERLLGFGRALERYPELRGNVSLIQVVVPSRTEIPKYRDLKEEIERLVGQINGRFTRSGWVPVHYHFRSMDREELLAYYRAAEIALITPLKDGMNLVAKEYCACKVEDDGVLILSEFAGSAAQLQGGALMVNPHDVEGVADAIHTACTMELEERRTRMRKLRNGIRRRDILWWVDTFLQAVFAKDLGAFPHIADYVHRVEAAGARR